MQSTFEVGDVFRLFRFDANDALNPVSLAEPKQFEGSLFILGTKNGGMFFRSQSCHRGKPRLVMG